jgi:DNA-directed RNA polymerase subunit N (RpoN/RPB10)
LADKVHGKHPNRGVENAKQVLDDLGVKKFTERDGGEAKEDEVNGKATFK